MKDATLRVSALSSCNALFLRRLTGSGRGRGLQITVPSGASTTRAWPAYGPGFGTAYRAVAAPCLSIDYMFFCLINDPFRLAHVFRLIAAMRMLRRLDRRVGWHAP